MALTIVGLTAAACIYAILQRQRQVEGARYTAVLAFMIALGQPVMSALVAVFSVWCLKVIESRNDGPTKARIVVEGLIGAGKSTLVKKLGGKCEEIEAWAPFLDWEYRKNPGRMLCRQVRILADYVTGDTACRVHERSWASALMFTSLMLSSHDKRFMQSYIALLKSIVRCNMVTLPSVVVYLNHSPTVCLARMKGRNHPGDDSANLEYLTKLEAAHETLMSFYSELGVTIIRSNMLSEAEIEACCREHMEASAEDTYDPAEVVTAIGRFFDV